MKKLLVGLFLTLASPALAQNYQATQGAGTTFGTKLVGGVNYPQFTMCDPTTPAQCMAVDASGRVTVLQGTSPWVVSNGGTFAVQAAQSGTWTVQPGNTANTTAWLVTGTGGTFPATQSGNWTCRGQDCVCCNPINHGPSGSVRTVYCSTPVKSNCSYYCRAVSAGESGSVCDRKIC